VLRVLKLRNKSEVLGVRNYDCFIIKLIALDVLVDIRIYIEGRA
jgi:hypothetical protein